MSLLYQFCALCGRPSQSAVCPSCASTLDRRELAHGCSKCGRPLFGEKDICWPCRDSENLLERVDAPFWYRGVSKVLLQDFKFQKGWPLADFFAQAMSKFLPGDGWVLVPVPAKRSSLETRGWDPVETLWKKLRTPFNPGQKIMGRIEGTQQKGLSRDGRKTNLEGHLYLKAKNLPAKIILIDDTYTTGATLNACAKLLLSEGALQVRGLCVTISP